MATPFGASFLVGLAPLQLVEHGLAAPTTAAGQRWQATRFRRRFLEGIWYQHLYEFAASERDEALLKAMGHLDLSECLFSSVIGQLGVLYSDAPRIRNEADISAWREDLALLFASHQDLNRSTLAYGESAIALDWTPTGVAPILVLPDEMDADPIAYGSRDLGLFRRATCRALPVGRKGAPVETPCWDVWDIRDPSAPRFEVQRGGGKAIEGMTLEGEAYPWRSEDGAPFIPAVLYHASEGHRLWSPTPWIELLWATLETAMTWSDWREGFRNASFLLRYLKDAEIDGAAAQGDGETATQHVPIMPNVLLRIRSRDKTGQIPGEAGVIAAPIDPLKHAEAIALRHKLRAHAIGLHPSDIEAGGSAESGVALTIRREGQRREQGRQAPLFRRGDLELLSKWAACMRIRRPGQPAPPESGWSIRYPGLPKSPQERKDEREQEAHDLELGLRDEAQILADREEISIEEAEARLIEMAARKTRIAAAAPAPAPAPMATLPADPQAPAPPEAPATGAPAVTTGASGALPLEPPPEPNRDPYPYSGRLDFQGLHILVETAAGETRSGTDPDGRPWSVTMPGHYGEIEGTIGLDDEPVDCMVGPLAEAAEAYVLHIRKPGAEAADEDKVYLGYDCVEDAMAAFEAAYTRVDVFSGLTRWALADLIAVLQDPAKQGIRLDAPPGSGLPEREPDAGEMDEESEAEEGGEDEGEET